jgi:hypothetical protein
MFHTKDVLMSRSLMFSLMVAAASISSCHAMQQNRKHPFICPGEIGDIQGTTKYIRDEYITASGERYYRKRTQESYCVQLANGDKLSTIRTNQGQGDAFRSMRFGKHNDEVDLSENSFRIVQQAYLERIGIWLSQQTKPEEAKRAGQ